jgi:hypothetical protein
MLDGRHFPMFTATSGDAPALDVATRSGRRCLREKAAMAAQR